MKGTPRLADRLHLGAALLHLALLPLSTSGATASFLLLLGTSLLRLRANARDIAALTRQPIVRLLAAWALWAALSLTWSSDSQAGFDQLRALRMLLLPLLLWPLRSAVPQWVSAVLVGVALQNLAQLLQLGGLLELKHEHAGRIGGFAHPIHTGLWSAAALCLALPFVLRAQSRRTLVLSSGSGLLALCGLVIAQSRGPWIAAALAVPIELWTLWTRTTLGASVRRRALPLGVAVAVALVAVGSLQGGALVERVDRAFGELEAFLADGTCTSDVGLRVCQWRWSTEVLAEHPLFGAGLGSFREEVAALPDFREALDRWPGRSAFLERKHPHNAGLHVLATQGIVGGVLFAALLILVLRSGWRNRGSPIGVGCLFATCVFCAGALFDSYDTSGRTLGLFALCASVACTFGAQTENPGRSVT